MIVCVKDALGEPRSANIPGGKPLGEALTQYRDSIEAVQINRRPARCLRRNIPRILKERVYMKTTISSAYEDAGNVVVHAVFEFPATEWDAGTAEAAVREFRADPKAPTVAALAAMTADDKRVAKQLGISPHIFARYNAPRK